MSTFQNELDTVLMSYFDRYEIGTGRSKSVEFIISSMCNQKCEYCYLMKHGKEMYPIESNKKENILTNLKKLLEWLELEKHFSYDVYDIFSGEFFQLPFWEEVFAIFYNFQKQYITQPRSIVIPTNGSFVMDDKRTERVEYWVHKFQEVKIDVFLSFSVDGSEALENIERPLNKNENKNMDNFYDKLFIFAKKHHFGFHPMITRNFVKNYKENYDWWINQIQKYDMTVHKNDGNKIYNIPMFLEVRDGDQWDDGSLQNYANFLKYMAESDLQNLHKGNIEDFMDRVLNDFPGDQNFSIGTYSTVQPYPLSISNVQNAMPCSIQKGPVFRVGDLALVPCHRTCYPNMVYGFLRTDPETGKITNFQAENVMLALKVKTLNPNRSFLKCSNCKLKMFCMKGCLGAQYESTGDLFAANEQVCKLYETKFKTIHEICEKYNLYELAEKNIYITQSRKELIRHARQTFSQL